MRKEAKRSLFIWPAVASATITTMSLFPAIVGPETSYRRQLRSAATVAEVVLDADFGAMAPEIELFARSEYGTRSMKMPDRVAEVFGADVLKAPVRDEQRELAGLVRRPSRDAENMLDLAENLLDGDMLAADQIAGNTAVAPDIAMVARTLQSLRNRSRVVVDSASPVKRQTPPLLVGPSRPEFWQPEFFWPPEIVVLEPPSLNQPSILPRSNRALGKRILEPPQSLATQPTPPSQPTTIVPQVAKSDLSDPVVADSAMVTINVEKEDSDPRPTIEGSPAGWPVTARLNRQLQTLSALAMKTRPTSRDQLVSSSVPEATFAEWSEEVSQRLSELHALPRLGDPRGGTLIAELSELARQGEQRAERLQDRQQQIEWLRASHAITRRVAVWRPVWEVGRGQSGEWMVSDETAASPESIQAAVEAVRADLSETGDVTGWTQYLLLDRISEATSVEQLDQRSVLAQRFLSRLTWHRLDPEQLRWLERDSITTLASAIRPWARDAVDYANLMSQIERQESNTIDLAAIDIADAVQTLRFAENPAAVRAAKAIDTYYRNANIRLAMSQPMLQRMLPTIDPRSVPVRTRMFGNEIRGTSRIESDLNIQLIPSPDRWSLQLKTMGNVRTQSTGINGSVAVRTAGDSKFVAATPIEVTKRGIEAGDSDVDVNGRTRLRGIRSEYDGWPLIGSLVRSIAENQYDSMATSTNQVGNQRIETQIRSAIDNQVDERLGTATQQLSEMVLGPLGKLRLDPKVMDMQTTDQRLVARYRLAGDWQLAAFTPRPRAPRSSLMSVQVHQSALNNTLEQLVRRDQPVSIHEMIRSAAETFGQTDLPIADDIPDDVSVQFARTRPITVEIEEGQLWVTLRIVRLNRGNRVELTQFIVRAAYKPQIDGMQASLVRDGHLRISGPGMSMRERLPVRAIFNKVLSPNRPIPLTLPRFADHPATEGLVISQLELRAGWVAMAMSENDAPRIALAP